MNVLVAPISLLAILLVGHFGLFFGDTFFADEDAITVLSYHSQNALSNGWRPDLGLGLAFYFGDPGLFHSTGFFRWWHQLFSDSVLAYNSSILILLWVASLSLYHLLKRAVPDLGSVTTIFLAALIVFGSLRHEFFFQRHWILLSISSCLVSVLLHDFLKNPLPKHFYQMTMLNISILMII